MIQVCQHRGNALAAIGAEGLPSTSVWVNSIIMLDVALAICVPGNLGQLHVTKRLASEIVDLLE